MSDFELDYSGTAYVLVRVRVAVPFAPGSLAGLRGALGSVFRGGRRFLAVDLTAGAVFGPQGYGPLIGALKTARDRGGDLYLVGASETVVGVLSHDSRGPVRCFGSVDELDRALLGPRVEVAS
jgi:hypothetical protein